MKKTCPNCQSLRVSSSINGTVHECKTCDYIWSTDKSHPLYNQSADEQYWQGWADGQDLLRIDLGAIIYDYHQRDTDLAARECVYATESLLALVSGRR